MKIRKPVYTNGDKKSKASKPFWLEATALGQFKFVMMLCAESDKVLSHILANLTDEEVMIFADVVYKMNHVLELNRKVIQERTK